MKLKFIFLFLPLLVSCDYVVNLKRTDEIITKEIEWNGATKIECCAPVRLIPVISNESKIEITGMSFIVNDYELVQYEDKLVIEHKNPSRLQEKKIADLILYAPKFEAFTINSVCKIFCKDTLSFDRLNFVINGRAANTTGNLILKGNNLNFRAYGLNKCIMNLSGEVKSVSYVVEGGTIVNAYALNTVKSEIIHKSYANCYVTVSELLDVKIYASGNIYYKGKPQVIFERIENNLFKATGEMIQLE